MRLRHSVRALVMDDDDHVLLARLRWEGSAGSIDVWANPGGGIEPGETRLAALQRELDEEVGLSVTDLGPEVWTKTAVFAPPSWDGQVDHVHLVRTARFAPRPQLSASQLQAEGLRELRWWSPDELMGSPALFAPRSLPSLLADLVRHGPPSSPRQLDGF